MSDTVVETAAKPVTTARRRTVDDYLGPGDRRFFGRGYKRADQTVRDLRMETDAEGTGHVSARASVTYPTDWSRKGKTDQPPHLSSIDVLLVAGEVAEAYLTHTLRLNAAERSRLRLRRVTIKAGRKPVEEELADFAVRAALVRLPATEPESGLRLTVSDCQVGALRVCCEIEHPTGRPDRAPGTYDRLEQVLGPPAPRPYAHAHKGKSQRIEDLSVDGPNQSAEALLSVVHDSSEPFTGTGLESHSHTGTSLLDAFVAAIQLGQILLYDLDSVDRADSNTLWMRQTVIDVTERHAAPVSPESLSVRLENSELLTTKEGEAWRACDITGRFHGLAIRCSVAHRLPRRLS
ncbi:AvrD family protein [Streptomyces sp. NPDC048109]|uniref:AvrD family protein n=1 Tax=unclassified Streptomyces TaxID=2593676 RepID=UPI0033FA50A5